MPADNMVTAVSAVFGGSGLLSPYCFSYSSLAVAVLVPVLANKTAKRKEAKI